MKDRGCRELVDNINSGNCNLVLESDITTDKVKMISGF